MKFFPFALDLDAYPDLGRGDPYGIDVVVKLVIIDGHLLPEGHHGTRTLFHVFDIDVSPIGIGQYVRIYVEFRIDRIDATAADGYALSFVVRQLDLESTTRGAIIEKQPGFLFPSNTQRA